MDIGVLVEGLHRAVDKTIENVAHALRFRRLHKDLIDISQQGHLAIPIRVVWVDQRLVVVRDPFLRIGSNQCFVKELSFFMTDIWN